MSEWRNLIKLRPRNYKCGYCGKETASKEGWYRPISSRARQGHHPGDFSIYICGGCNRPTYFDLGTQTPAPDLGNDVDSLPSEVESIYREARQCTKVEAYTACVLALRKLLMHIAVEKGAPENQNFFQYVEYLDNNGYIPQGGRGWVDHIRTKGNEANHEIVEMSKDDASDLLSFAEMLLRIAYEFPTKIPPPPAP